MDTVNVSFVDWIPKSLCNKNIFHSCYDNDDEDNFTHGNGYMYIPLENEITNDKILKQNFIKKNATADDDKYLNYDNLTDSSVSIEDSDRLLVLGSNYDDSSTLQIALYNVDTCGLETHHEILLNGYPLTMQLVPRQNMGMLSCVGSYSPDITIWDIYDVDQLEPLSVLSLDDNKNTKRAIMSLDYSNPLLSAGSEDSGVYIWDLHKQELVSSFHNHTGKVQVVKWHNKDKNLLVSGAFDNKLLITDIRSSIAQEILVNKDIECAVWYKDTESLLCGFEDGMIKYFDLRNIINGPIWSIKNSKTPCTSLCIKNDILCASCLSGSLRVYKINGDEYISNTPQKIYKKKLEGGPIFTSSVSKDDDYIFAFGCKMLVIADLLTFEDLKYKLQINHQDDEIL